MTAFVEKIAVEIVVTLCVGAVVGFISVLLSTPDEAARQNRRLACRHCGSDAMLEAKPDQVQPGNEPQQ
jgi:hypothetical protein